MATEHTDEVPKKDLNPLKYASGTYYFCECDSEIEDFVIQVYRNVENYIEDQ